MASPASSGTIVFQRQKRQSEAQQRETGGLSPGEEMKEPGKSNRQDDNGPAMRVKTRTLFPYGVTTERIDQKIQRQPRCQCPSVRQAGKGREEQRHLRPVQSDVHAIGCSGDELVRQFSLGSHVVQQVATTVQCEVAQRVEVQEIGSLDQTIAIDESRSRHVDGINRP